MSGHGASIAAVSRAEQGGSRFAKVGRHLVGRGALATLGAGLALFGIWALVFARSSSTGWVADRSALVVELDSIITDLEVTHERLKQAVVLTAAVDGGVAAPEVLAGATDDLQRRLSALAESTAPSAATPFLVAYVDAGKRAVTAVEEGRAADAVRLANGELPSIRADLVSNLDEERMRALLDIEQARTDAGTLATMAGFLVALVIPATVVAVYRAVARRQLRKAGDEARANADRNLAERRDQFIAGVSHELRTPLTSIYGLSSVLADRSRLEESVKEELIQLLIGSATDLTRMVDDLIAAARHQTGDLGYYLTPVHVADLINEVTPMLGNPPGEIQVLLEETDAEVIADPLRFRHLLRNLLDNADRHGGSNVRLIGRRVGSRYRIEVADDGEGIPEHRANQLFEPYVHTGDSPLTTGSIGLGLSVAKALATGMGGSLWYEREEGWSRMLLELDIVSPGRADSTWGEAANG